MNYEIITLSDTDYPVLLKKNMGDSAPERLYIRGDRDILNKDSIAMVGSRNALEISLLFTDNIVKMACENNKVVVSGFAKGVDQQALSSTIKYGGKSIIVLPQGISTFHQYFDSNVLVLSIFPPEQGWNTKFAMARNTIIYGLANEVYIAESKPYINQFGIITQGGTWAGAVNGLRKGRKIFIRNPEPHEVNSHPELIKKGAIPLDMTGKEVETHIRYTQLKAF